MLIRPSLGFKPGSSFFTGTCGCDRYERLPGLSERYGRGTRKVTAHQRPPSSPGLDQTLKYTIDTEPARLERNIGTRQMSSGIRTVDTVHRHIAKWFPLPIPVEVTKGAGKTVICPRCSEADIEFLRVLYPCEHAVGSFA